MNKFIPIEEVTALTGLKKATIYKYIRDGKFPKQIKISRRAARWKLQAVIEWMKQQEAAQDQ